MKCFYVCIYIYMYVYSTYSKYLLQMTMKNDCHHSVSLCVSHVCNQAYNTLCWLVTNTSGGIIFKILNRKSLSLFMGVRQMAMLIFILFYGLYKQDKDKYLCIIFESKTNNLLELLFYFNLFRIARVSLQSE